MADDSQTDPRIQAIRNCITSTPNFPKEGIIWRDIWPLFSNVPVRNDMVDFVSEHIRKLPRGVDVMVGLESRGFLFTMVAHELGLPFVPIRKKGKLPGPVQHFDFQSEYGEGSFEIQTALIKPGTRVVLMDDLLATGGSLSSSAKLLKKVDPTVTIEKAIVIIELVGLEGRKKLMEEDSIEVVSLVTY